MRAPVVFTASVCGLWTPAFQSSLTRAARLARGGKYDAAAQLLESEIYNYRDSFMFFYLLGLCSLYGGNYGGAHDYLMRARELKPREPAVLLALAALYVKRTDTRRAISLYLEAQDIDGKNRIAKRALKVLRKYSGSDDLAAWIEAGKLRSLYPPLPHEKLKAARIARNMIAAVATAAAAAVVAGFVLGKFNPLPRRADREGFAESVLVQSETEKPLQTGGVFQFMLTERQILSTYNLARRLFNEGRDNAAMVEINRIIESNASEGIKNRARVMSRYLEPPGFDALKQGAADNIKYADAAKAPLLYRDCYVLWSGMAANIVEGRNETAFDFLVGYDGRRVVEGVIRVNLPFAASVSTEYPLEVLGKITPADSGGGLALEGVTIHQPVIR
jgi:tetratricopeptide (TPR) repeat protein